MEKQRLENLQKKTAGVVNEGIRVLKDSLREAGRLLGATADATKLHIEKEARVIETHRDFHKLGEEVYRLIKEDPRRVEIKISGTMRDLVKRIRKAEDEISKSRERLSHMTVVTAQKKTMRSSRSRSVKAVPRRPQRRPQKKRNISPRKKTK